MKPHIDQSLLDSLPIGGPIMDFNFAKNWVENTAMFHAHFTMINDTRECAAACKFIIRALPETLN